MRPVNAMSGRFPRTRYSVVAAVRSDKPEERRAAFDVLVAAYWKPAFKYLRLKWHASPEDAADLTQGFFLRALEKSFFAGFDPRKALFRTYVRICLDGFVSNARKAEGRMKRGGHLTLVSLEFDEAERELQRAAIHTSEDVDGFFHREWLRGLFAAAAARLRDSCVARGRPNRYVIFERHDLSGDEPPPTYAELAREFGITPTSVTNELAAGRREFRGFVLQVLRAQCASDEEFEAEARALGHDDL
jgi:DNA-directed RNA polymerase specialized sigma24 family protein